MNDIVIQFDHIKLCLTLRMIGTEPHAPPPRSMRLICSLMTLIKAHHQARALNTQHFPFARKEICTGAWPGAA
jgi:hypothetical protein